MNRGFMPTLYHGVLWTLTLTMLLTTSATAFAGEPSLRFAPDRVIAEGLSPGTDAVLFAVVHRRLGWKHVIERIDEVITDDDRDGQVELVWKRGNLPYQSVWIVIDSRNGKYASSVPPSMTRREVALRVEDLVRESNDVIGVVQQQRRYVEVLLSHPGFGVWGTTTGDGGSNDADGEANGRIHINFEQMQPIHTSSQAPRVMPNGGIIAIIDGLSLEFGVSRVSGGGHNASTLVGMGGEVGR